jgi:rhamnosyl/mannosyltransferase
MGMAAYLLARKSKTHRLVVTHHSDTIRQARLRKVFEPVFARVMTRADLIITTSNRYLQTSAELAPYRDKAVVVPYGIDTRAFENVTESETKALREKYGAPLVLSVGRLIYYKGFDVLLEAMRRIDAKAIIIGSGPLRSQLEEQSRERGLDGRVRFLGDIHNDRLAPFFAAADVFVLPSVARSEAFGIVQIEAMAAGVPVINTMLDSGVPEVSIDGVTGLTVPPGDPSALALAIQRMLADRGLRNSFSTAGRARARMEFGLGTMVARVSALYGQLAASPSR